MKRPTRDRLTATVCGLGLIATLIAGEWFIIRGAQDEPAFVVINEIFYNAGGDNEQLEWIELHNPTQSTADVSGWKLLDGVVCTLPPRAFIAPGGYWVVCADRQSFEDAYGRQANGEFNKSLNNGGERIQLADATGRRVDSVEYQDQPPWPLSPDGYSSSLERIRADRPGELQANWEASAPSDDSSQPGGTPGRVNSVYADSLPPLITRVSFSPQHPAPGEPLHVQANVESMSDGKPNVSLLYRTAGPGSETEEIAIPMQMDGSGCAATIPGHPDGSLLRFRIRATDSRGSARYYPSPHDIRPALSTYVADDPPPHTIPLATIIHVGKEEFEAAKNAPAQNRFGPPGFGGFGPRFGPQTPEVALPTQGRAAFVYRAPNAETFELFDFVNVTPRKAGYKVRFHKDRPLGDITTLNIINEGSIGFALAEVTAYELYRRVGNAAPLSDIVRLSVDGNLRGYHLSFEQPNRGFLRRNGIDDRGNLYKIQWMGRDLVGQHEKKTNTQRGHDDLIALVDALESSNGDSQWDVIQKHFNVLQVANYFAVNMVLSHWDGFFNNYFTYQDTKGTGGWEMYPWDQDQTHGYYGGIPAGEVFYDMPLTFGMEGDTPPGRNPRQPAGAPFGFPGGGPPNFGAGPGGFRGGPPGFGGGPMWWRPGGYFSRPLLANARFRTIFLQRVKDIAENVFTEEAFSGYLDDWSERLLAEAEIQATALGNDPRQNIQDVEQGILDIKRHLTKRREFLLDQAEIRALAD